MKIKVCMLLAERFKPKMKIVPQIGIASFISNFGHKVTWVLASEDNDMDKIKNIEFDGIKLIILPIKNYGGLFSIISKVKYVWAKTFFLVNTFKENQYNLIFVRDDIFSAILALFLKKWHRIPFIFQSSNPIEQGWQTREYYSNGHLSRLKLRFTKIEIYLYRYILLNADLVLATTKWMKNDFVNKGVKNSKIMSFPNGVNPNRFFCSNGTKIRKKYQLNDSKIFVYIGSLDKTRDLKLIIHAFSRVLKNEINAKLIFVGDGTDKNELEMIASKLKIDDDVIFTGQIDFDDVPDYIGASDIGISMIKPLGFFQISSPIKLFEYMVMKKPVIANCEINEQKEVINESEGGVLINFDEESLFRAMLNLTSNPNLCKKLGDNGQEWVLKNRTYEILSQKIENRYLELLK